MTNGTDTTNEKTGAREILLERMLDAADWARKLGMDPVALMAEAVGRLDADAMVVVNKLPEQE